MQENNKYGRPRILPVSFIIISSSPEGRSAPVSCETSNTNLIAYEQYLNPENHRLFITDYVTFMDHLINSAKGAKGAGKVCHDEIIKNWLGDDEAISTMFNKLGNNVYINNQHFSYSQVFNNVNKHCRRRWNRWLANLRESNFNSPWTIISVLAAAVLLLLILIQAIFSVLSYTKIVEGTVHINGKASIGRIDEDFICATLDWWPPEKCDYGTCSWGTASLLNLDLSNTTLLNAIKAFSPLKIRLGGTLQDKVIYQSLGAQQPCTQFVLNSAEMFSFTQGCLPMSRWDELNIFFKKSRAKVIFGLNALSGRTIGSDGSAVGAWNSSNAESLIRYTVNKGYSIHGWELGNELSGNGIGASVAADQYVSDVNSLQNIVQNIYRSFRVKPLVLGPGGFFDVNWFTEFIDKTNNSLQVATHHIYNLGPGVDDHLVDKILDPSYLDGGSQPFSRLQRILKSSGTSTTAWVGEAGGAYNSGHNLVTNAFVFSFWYLDQLGMSSSYDTKTYCRQTLIGGNYGLLNTTTFAPNPDYYSALLWHRLMGRNVLSTSFSGTNKIRAYAHCSKISAGITLLLINLDGNTTVQVGVSVENATTNGTSTLQQTHLTRRTKFARIPHHFKIGENTREEYHLTAKDGDLHSQTVLLNGKILTLNSSGNIPPLEPIRVNLSEPITVAPFSIVFVHIHSIHVPACR